MAVRPICINSSGEICLCGDGSVHEIVPCNGCPDLLISYDVVVSGFTGVFAGLNGTHSIDFQPLIDCQWDNAAGSTTTPYLYIAIAYITDGWYMRVTAYPTSDPADYADSTVPQKISSDDCDFLVSGTIDWSNCLDSNGGTYCTALQGMTVAFSIAEP